jgi:hypothetical protein
VDITPVFIHIIVIILALDPLFIDVLRPLTYKKEKSRPFLAPQSGKIVVE